MSSRASAKFVARKLEIALGQSEGRTQRVTGQRERCPRRLRIASADPNLDRFSAIGECGDELESDPALSDPGRAGDQHHARDRFLLAFVEYRLERAHFAFSTYARHVLAKEASRGLEQLALADQCQAPGVADDLETARQEARAGLVQRDSRVRWAFEQKSGPIDDIAERNLVGN